MRTLLLGLTAIVLLASLPLTASEAHGRHGSRARISVGIGVGYPAFYPGYFGYYGYGGWHPRAYLGLGVSPRYRSRTRTERRGEVRNQALYVYPAAGQSEAQLAEDRYQCHVWAADASDYDPTLGAGTRAEADSYARAFTACMEGRDYVVK